MAMLRDNVRIAARRGVVFYVLLACLFLLFSGLLLAVFRGERKKNRVLIRYEAERTALDAGQTLMRSQSSGESLPESVIGYGAYNEEGMPILQWGTAPDRFYFEIGPHRNRRYVFNRAEKTLTLLVEPGRRPEPGWKPEGRIKRPKSPEPRPPDRFEPENRPRYFYLEMSTAGYYQKELFLSATLVALLAILAAILVIALWLFERYRRYMEKLEEQKQLVHLGEAARTLSHEIKNPLSAIRIRAGILKKTVPGESAEDVAIIEEEIDRLTLLSEKVGEFLKKPQGTPEIIELNGFVRDLLGRYGDSVTVEGSSRCYVSFDPDRLRSVIENLVKNAIESGAGSGEDAVVRITKTKNLVTVSVLDRGPGIDPDIEKKVFDPFFTTKTTGSGIGLAISKRFVEAANGIISLSPREGGGTEAKIVLKREKDEDPGR